MPIRASFEESMQAFGIKPGSAPVFLAISGGVDSMVLAHLLKAAGYNATWLHMNFQLRGEESERDQRFVESIANEWGQRLLVSRVEAAVYAEDQKISIQESARALRYGWFEKQIQSASKDAVLLTAHHADDKVETVLMNFLRGTGINGLAGIPSVNGYVHRPLLNVTRAQIDQYAKEHKIEFVEDSSNRSTDYTRNQIRLELLPMLRTIYPQVDNNLLHNIDRFKSIQLVYRQAVDRWIRKYIQLNGEEQQVAVALITDPNNRAMLHEWMSRYGFTEKQEGEVIRMAESQSGHFIVSPDGKYRILRHRKHFILSAANGSGADEQWVEAGEQQIVFAGGKLDVKMMEATVDPSTATSETALLDATELTFPLLLRKWRAGDYFYPLGLNKKKKVARFLIDQKLSVAKKEKVWVLESGGRIAWVIGQRIDHRFRVSESTSQIIRISSAR